MSAPRPWALVVGTHLMAASIGWHYAPREILDEVKQEGFFKFSVDTRRVLSATVLSLRAENKLRVWSYRGEADVLVEQSSWWFLHGSQELQVPANIGYYLDLSDLTMDRVKFDEDSKTVFVTLPRLTLGDVAFDPVQARFINGGLLTYSQETVDEFSRLNYASARKAFVKQAGGTTLVQAAQREAVADIQAYFAIPLRVAGKDVRVVARFEAT